MLTDREYRQLLCQTVRETRDPMLVWCFFWGFVIGSVVAGLTR